MAVGVYLRVSSTTQSVASQRREIERYLAGQNVDDARWYIDEGVSGSIMVRPALEKLKQAIFLGQVNTVVVYSLDRLARNAIEGLNLIAGWLQHQIRLVVITTRMDFSGEVGQMVRSGHGAEVEPRRCPD